MFNFYVCYGGFDNNVYNDMQRLCVDAIMRVCSIRANVRQLCNMAHMYPLVSCTTVQTPPRKQPTRLAREGHPWPPAWRAGHISIKEGGLGHTGDMGGHGGEERNGPTGHGS